MKRIILATVILLLTCMMVYAQQAQGGLPSSSQTRQTAQQYLSQARTNSTQFESILADLTARNTSNRDLENFNRLRADIDRLEASINIEQSRLNTNLASGRRVDPEMLNRIQRLIDQHKAKLAELEAFISN
jgi:DNA anti-recombination protein RmuC